MKKVYIKTFGCQMNVHDSRRMRSLLEDKGYAFSEDPERAEIILFNTCSVRDKARQKFVSALGEIRELKEKNPSLIIGVGGCVAELEGRDLVKKFSFVDFSFGPDYLNEIDQLIKDASLKRKNTKDGFRKERDFKSYPDNQPRPANFVTIMQGCNNFCSYCVVPYARGPEKSRLPEGIISEIKGLVRKGAREVTLLGQNVNSYQYNFPELLKRVDEIKGLKRIRFTTSHPKNISSDLIACFGNLEKLCEHLHLPFQSGSNRILSLMNRHYSRERYLEIISQLRETCPEIGITADVMVGFPGEEEEDYERTLDLIERVRFDNLFSFRYSPRPGTAAVKLEETVSLEIARERLMRLQARQKKITQELAENFKGKELDVLVEGRSVTDFQKLTGHSRTNRVVNFLGSPDLVGKLIKIKIKKIGTNSLDGEIEC